MNSPKTNRKIWLGVAFAVALLLLTSPRTAVAQQWTTTNNDISNTNTGNVGIGTSTPIAKFQILAGGETFYWGSGTVPYPSVPNSNSGNLVGRAVTSDYRIALQDGNGRVNHYWNAYYDLTAGAHKYLVSNEPSARFRVSINGATGGYFDFLGAAAGTAGSPITWTTYGIINDTNIWWSPRGNSSDFFINSSGNVGIGTAAPASKLHLGSGEVGMGQQNDPTPYMRMGMDSSYFQYLANNAYWTGTAYNYVNPGGYGGMASRMTQYSGTIYFETASGATNPITWNTRMYVANNGNVGVGTTNPIYRLDVNGTVNATGLSINGSPITGSVFGRTGAVVAATNDYTWAQINKSTSSLADISIRSASDLNSGTVPIGRLGASGTADSSTFLRGDNTWAVPSGGSQWTNGSNSISYSGGNVGIGTTTPGEKLQVHGNVELSSGTITSGVRALTPTGWGYSPNYYRVLMVGASSGNETVSIGYDPSGITNGSFWGDGREVLFRDGASFTTPNVGANTFYYNTVVLKGGNVGIGASNPGYKLDVAGVINSSTGGFRFPDGTVQTTAASSGGGGAVASVFGRTGAVVAATNDYTWAQINKTTSSLADLGTRSASDLSSGTLPNAQFPATLPAISGANLTNLNATSLTSGTVATARLGSGTADGSTFLRGDNTWAVPSGGSQWTTSGSNINYATAGNVGIGTPTPTSKLHVTGDGRFTGNLTVDGNIAAKYQDVAEWVPTSEQIPAGTVVVLDTTKSNQVVRSTQSYDTRVAGVISEQPGITLGEGGEGKVLVATTGRVLVQVDATNSPIHIGDLLVTSDVPGVAMKSTPVNLSGIQLHRPGTIIGKALEPLEKGSGKILVLLSLQ